ncbi:MAG: hypothetical protein H6707_18325 [Deltaproteobacteria bacterium]|nr:hypothetical protein [Deltaproteobacteria bacterium]
MQRLILGLAIAIFASCSDSGKPALTDLRSGDLMLATDASRLDSATAAAGFGAISGSCGVLDEALWQDSAPKLFDNHLDFADRSFSADQLSEEARRILSEGTAGGSSGVSEAMAFELLRRCEGAQLLLSETKIGYQDANGKKTDLLVQIDGRSIGVSVTRGYHFPPNEPYTAAEARALWQKKLSDLPLSQKNAQPSNAWQRSVLAILAVDKQAADLLTQVYKNEIDAQTKGDAIVLLTITDGQDQMIYQ